MPEHTITASHPSARARSRPALAKALPIPDLCRSGRTAIGASARAFTARPSTVTPSVLNRICPTISASSAAANSTAATPLSRSAAISRDSAEPSNATSLISAIAASSVGVRGLIVTMIVYHRRLTP
jgi:hypothetical protein